MKANTFVMTFLKLCILVLAGILLATALMIGVYLLPTGRVKDHVTESAELIEFEGDYPTLTSMASSCLDNYTDALMLQKAAFEGKNIGLIEKAMMVYNADNGPFSFTLDQVWQEPEGADGCNSYSRYWHGYLCFLKPLLWFFNYRELRMVNLYLQVALVAIICVLLKNKGYNKYILAFLMLILMQSPVTTSMSLQNSTIYYIYLVSSLVLLSCYQKLRSSGLLIYLFIIIGGTTSFLDFLTYPLVSFGVPFIFCLIQETENRKLLRFFVLMLAAWGMGYAGIWAGKWIVGSLLTGENIISNAMGAVHDRTSGSFQNVNVGLWLIVRNNAVELIKNPVAVLVSIATVLLIAVKVLKGEAKKVFTGKSGIFLLSALLPLGWYMVLRNHSYVHSPLFTWRELLISGFAMTCWLAYIVDWNKIAVKLARK